MKLSVLLIAMTIAPGIGPRPAQGQEGPESSASANPLGSVFGEGGLDMKLDGTMTLDPDPETGELRKLVAHKNIRIKSDTINLNCEDLEIDMVKQIMTATGSPVVFDREDIGGQCSRFVYDLETKRMKLYGPPKPVIRQKAKNGNVTQTKANKISITPVGKGNRIEWEGQPEFLVVPAKPKQDASAKSKKTPATKLDGSKAEKLIRGPVTNQ